MGHIPVAKPSPILREWTFPRRGLLIALVLLGVFAVFGVALASAWPTGSHVDPASTQWVKVANINDLQVNTPENYSQYRTWLVKLQSGEVLALYQRSTSIEPCAVPWRPDFTYNNRTGWFRSPCHGDTYDLTGACFTACTRGLDRFQTRVRGDNVEMLIGKNALILGPPKDLSVAPMVPGQR